MLEALIQVRSQSQYVPGLLSHVAVFPLIAICDRHILAKKRAMTVMWKKTFHRHNFECQQHESRPEALHRKSNSQRE